MREPQSDDAADDPEPNVELQRLRELTRKLVNVPKTDLDGKRKPKTA